MVKLSKPLDEVKTTRYGEMPEGVYSGYVEEAAEQVSKAGNEMLKLKVILDGNESHDGKVLFHYLVMGLDHSEEAVLKFCRAAGLDTEGRTELKPDECVGLPVRFQTKHEEYNGEVESKIHYFIEAEQKPARRGPQTDGNPIPF